MSEIKGLADLVSGRAHFLFQESRLLAVPSSSRRGQRSLWDLFYKGKNPLMTKSPPKCPTPLNIIALGIKFQHIHAEGHVQSIHFTLVPPNSCPSYMQNIFIPSEQPPSS